MSSTIELARNDIAHLCRKYKVKRLELFGSAARGELQTDRSDFDFFYEFESNDYRGMADRFFELQRDLQELLGRPVDLVSMTAARSSEKFLTATQQTITFL